MDIFCKIKDASIDPKTKELVNEICLAKVPIFENRAKTFAQEHKLSKEVQEEISGLMIAAYFEALMLFLRRFINPLLSPLLPFHAETLENTAAMSIVSLIEAGSFLLLLLI